MPLIRCVEGQWSFHDDPYTFVDADQPCPDGAIAVPLARFVTDREALLQRDTPLAVIIPSDQSPDILARDLDRISAVLVTFPKFRDGRGYSWARLLRQRFGFRGELRAIGEALRDQWLFMVRCGFDAIDVRTGTRLSDFQAALAEQTVFYQPAMDGRGQIGRAIDARRAAE